MYPTNVWPKAFDLLPVPCGQARAGHRRKYLQTARHVWGAPGLRSVKRLFNIFSYYDSWEAKQGHEFEVSPEEKAKLDIKYWIPRVDAAFRSCSLGQPM